MKKYYIHLDTRTRVNAASSTTAQPEWDLQSSIRFRKLRLVSALIPFSVYTVPEQGSATGLALQLAGGGGATITTLTCQAGIFTLSELASKVQLAMRASGLAGAANFTCTSSAETLKLTFGHNAGFNLVISTTLWSNLTGLPIGTHASEGGSNSVLSQSLPELAPTHLKITSRTLGNASAFYPSAKNTNIREGLFHVPCDVNVGSMINYQWPNYGYRQEVDFNGCIDTSQIQLELRTPNGDMADPNMNWSVVLEYTE